MARKSYFTLSEIANEFKVKKSHIRFYDKKGLISPRNNKLGRRIYNQHDRTRLEFIFHFELIEYSLDHISELIGIPDENMDKIGQFRKSLEYGEKKLEELKNRSKEIKFPDRISVMKEINMMREYTGELNKIDPLKLVPEKKLKRKHIWTIPVYVGLSLTLIIAGYFFYQGGKTLNLAQKKTPKTEASSVHRYPVPIDDTGDQQNVASQLSETPDSPKPIQGDSFIEESKELANKEPIRDWAETVILSKATPNNGLENFPLLSTESTDAIIDVESYLFSSEQKDLKVFKEKALLKESESVRMEEGTGLTKRAEAAGTLQAGPFEDRRKLNTQVNKNAAIKMKHIDSKVTQLTRTVAASDETKQTDYKPLTVSYVEKTKLNTVQDKTQPDNYAVSFHYTCEKNKELMEYLANLLQLEGFGVLGMEKVDYQNSDIRYFHSEDKAGALLLQKYSTKFITPFMNLEDTNIKIKDLSQKYPNARKGVLEVWLNNNFFR